MFSIFSTKPLVINFSNDLCLYQIKMLKNTKVFLKIIHNISILIYIYFYNKSYRFGNNIMLIIII